MKSPKKKSILKKIANFLLSLVLIFMLAFAAFATFYIVTDDADDIVDDIISSFASNKKDVVNVLICGVNQNMTDTILYVRYEVKTGKIGMMSIPRDTSISGSTPTASASNKINSIYQGKNADKLVDEVEKILNVSIDYYLIFDSTMLINMVDAIGGIEVDVPIRMKYDDPTQNLHIDLQPGTQVLNGKQAEQFVRFRKNNDGTGYARGDIDRTETQQKFIKKFIKEVLSLKNIIKIKSLIGIALDGTNTNITLKDAMKYVTHVGKIDTENIETCTAPGEFYDAKYPYWVSFWIIDKKEAQRIINEQFTTN